MVDVLEQPTEEPESVNPFDQAYDRGFANGATNATNAAPTNPFDAIGPDVESQTSVKGAVTRGAVGGVLPALASMPVMGAGMAIGAAAGAATGPLAPVMAPVGGVIGAFGGAIAGGYLGHVAQDYLLSMLPESYVDALGQSESQRRRDQEEHPVASFVGGTLPFLLTMKPGPIGRSVLPPNATPMQKIMVNPVTARLFGGAVQGGVELGMEMAHGEAPDWAKVGIATGVGVVWNKPTRAGERLMGLGSRPVESIQRRLTGEKPTVPGARPFETEFPEGMTQDLPPEWTHPAEAPKPIDRTGEQWLELERIPTVAQAADMNVLGPGVTEEVYHGQHEADPSARMSNHDMRRSEQMLTEEPPKRDAHAVARQMHPETFAIWDDLMVRRETFRDWIAEAEAAGQDAPAAREHLATTEKVIDELAPDVAAAYRRAADAAQIETTEARMAAEAAPGAAAEAPIAPIAPEAPGMPPEPGAAPAATAAPAEAVPLAQRPIEDQKAFIANDVMQRLILAGRPAEEAQAAGSLWAARFEARAARFKGALGTAEELYRTEGADIRAGRGVAPAAKVGERELLQTFEERPGEVDAAATEGLEPAGVGGGRAGGAGRARSLEEAQRAAETARGNAHVPIGLPTKPLAINGEPFVPGPIGRIQKAAQTYTRDAGIDYQPPRTYQPVDIKRAERIAQAFEEMKHAPDDPRVKASYDAMIKETNAQFDEVLKDGLKIEFIKPGQDDPYTASPRLAAKDVIDNNHLWVFPTDIGFGMEGSQVAANPLLAKTKYVIDGHQLLANDVFRIVHDYFGHLKDGNGFRAVGEEHAWRSHSAMYSPLARGAMTSETRGQNSWLNYGPHGEKNRTAKSADTVYADQKTGLLPDWVMDEGRLDPGVEPHPDWIDTSLVTSKRAEATTEPKIVSLETMKETPKLFEHNVNLVRDYPNLPEAQTKGTPDQVAENFIQHATDNLLWLFDQIDPAIRERSTHWYVGARKIVEDWSQEFGLKDSAVSGVIAAMSPQKDWFRNVSLARRVLDITAKPDVKFSPEMAATFEATPTLHKYRDTFDLIKDKSLSEIDGLEFASDKLKRETKALWVRLRDEAHNDKSYRLLTPEGEFGDFIKTQKGENAAVAWGSLPEIAKAIGSIESGGQGRVLSALMGMKHKVRNFYNNMLDPWNTRGDVTIDTHAVAASLLRPLSGASLEVNHNFGNYAGKGIPAASESAISGISGTYPLYAEAYRRAARQRGVLPRELQSITWEAVRGLFPDDLKGAKLSAAIDDLWQGYRQGRASLDDTRAAVLKAGGGIRKPEWVGRPAGVDEVQQRPADAGELARSGVPGEAPGPDAGRVGSRDTGAVPVEGVEQAAEPRGYFQRDEPNVDWSLIRAAEESLPPEAQRALDQWVGGPIDAIARGQHFGLFDPRSLKRALADPVIGPRINAAMEPVRAALRAQHGDSIALYRYSGPRPENAEPRALLSFTTDRGVAEQMSGASPRAPRAYSPEEIAAAEKQLAETGTAKLGRFTFERSPGGEYVDIHDPRVGGFLTDTESITAFARDENAYAAELNADRSGRLAQVRTYEIPVDDIVAATDRFNQKEIIVRNTSKILDQTTRGKISFAEGRKPIITLMREANASTFIHESGHHFLEQLLQDAAHEKAPADLVQDAKKAREWLGVGEDGEVKTKHHEKWARGFEQYLREGVAPSKELASVFAQFRDWLLRIYESIKGLGAPINEDIRQVFDRMLAMEPERTVIARDRERGPTLADIHTADAAHATPAEAEPMMARVEAETLRAEADLPEAIRNELNIPAAAAGTEPGAAPQPSAVEPGAVAGGGVQPQPVAAGGGGGAQHGPLVDLRGEARGTGVAAGAERGAAERAKPAGPELPPLESRPAALFGPDESPLTDKAGNIRLENLTTSDDVAQAIRDSAAENQDFIGDRRAVVTDGQVMDLANDIGMPGAEKLVTDWVVGRAYNAEQVMALRKLLVESATDLAAVVRKAATGTDDDVMAYALAKDRHQMIQRTVAGATAEAGRALRAFRNISMGAEAMAADQVVKAATGKTLFQLKREAQLATAIDTPQKMSKFMQDAQKRSFGNMALEYWINGLLSGYPTHVTNIVSNTILAVHNLGEVGIAAGLGALKGREGGRVYFGEVGARARGAAEGLPSALKATGQSAVAGTNIILPGEEASAHLMQPTMGVAPQPSFDTAATMQSIAGDAFAAIRGARDAILSVGATLKANGEAGAPLLAWQPSLLGAIPDVAVRGVTVPVGSVVRAPGRFLAAADAFQVSLNYRMALNALAYREASDLGLSGSQFSAHIAKVLNSPGEAQMAMAVREARQLTLMGKGGPLLAALQHLSSVDMAGIPIGKFIMPFVRVAGNIMSKTIERTPFAYLSSEMRADLLGRNGNVAQDMAQARVLLGTTLAVGLGTLAAEGLATGSGPTDPNERKMWQMTGRQPHSVRIGDMWYPIQRLGPTGMLMSLAADMYEVSKFASDGEMEEAGGRLIHAFSQNILDQSMLKGPADLLRAIQDPERYGGNYVSNTIASFVPFSVGMQYAARSADPYMRETRSSIDAIRAKIPGHLDQWFDNELMPKRDIWGEMIQPPQVVAGFLRGRAVSDDPVVQAMNDLGIAPGPVKRTLRNVELTDQQYDDFARLAGRMAKQRLDVIVGSPDWQRFPPSAKHDIIVKSITAAREAARGMLMMKYPTIPREAAEERLSTIRGENISPIR